MVAPSRSFMSLVAEAVESGEVVGAITASMEIENQNEVLFSLSRTAFASGARACGARVRVHIRLTRVRWLGIWRSGLRHASV
jgi:hypothetical protein